MKKHAFQSCGRFSSEVCPAADTTSATRGGGLRTGQAALTTIIFFLLISSAILGSFSSMALQQRRITRINSDAKQGYFVSEAGIEDALYRVSTGKKISSEEVLRINNSIATTTITQVGPSTEIIATGDTSSSIRRVKAELLSTVNVQFNYGAQIGNGGLEMENNSTVRGSVYSNGNIVGDAGVTITGDAFSGGIIEDVTVQGSSYENQPPLPFPIQSSVIDQWKQDAQNIGTIASGTCAQEWSPPSSPYTVNGGVIEKKVKLDNNQILIFKGTVWAKCSVDVDNGASIRLDSSYGSFSGVFVSDGWMHFKNNGQLQGSGQAGSYIMFVTMTVGGGHHGSAIDFHNNATGAIFYAPNGLVYLHNNIVLTSVIANALSLDNNAELIYEIGLQNLQFASGPQGGISLTSWKETE